MERHIIRFSYWLGMACSVVAVVWKGLAFLKVLPGGSGSFSYMTLYKGGLLFLVFVIATAGIAVVKDQKA